MLKLITRLERTRNFILLLFAVVMVASLVFFYTPTQNTAMANLSQSEEAAAYVGSEKITVGELVRQKENYERFSRGQSFPAKMLLDGLISNRMTKIEAARLGLVASDQEVAAQIRETFKPEEGKPFDQQRYEQIVTEQFGSISSYEESIRGDISGQKLNTLITSGVTVSEADVLADFQRKNAKFDVSYVTVSVSDLAKKLTPSDVELREYFEKNKSSYYINSPQKKIKYIFVNTTKMGEKLQLTDAELRTEYDNLPAERKLAGVLGQEIVLRVPKPDQESQIQTKAVELIQRLRKDGATVAEDVFADVAKGFSENPATAPLGGKLSGPVKENVNKPDDPYQRLLRMKPGDITEPISYSGRIFILRRGEDVPKSFEDAKKEIEVSLRNRRAYTAAADLAQKISEALKENKDINKTAADFAAQANMSVAEMIRETDYVKPGDEVPNVGISPQFEDGIAPLENIGDVGEKTPIQNGFAIPTMIDKKDPRDATFEEVRKQVEDVVRMENARAQVEVIAKAIAEGATNAAGLNAAASAKGLSAGSQKDFVLGSPLGQGPTASTSQALEDAIYAMKAGDVSKSPLKLGDDWVVFGVNSREDASSEEFAKQRSGLTQQLLAQRRSAVYGDYLAALKQRYESTGKIRLYKDAIAKVDLPLGGAPIDMPVQN